MCVCAEDESEFDYIKGSKKGPSRWGELKKEWAACKGTMQSPIDLSSHRVRVVPKLGELNKYYKPQNATVKNRGHDIEVIIQSRKSLMTDDTFHFSAQSILNSFSTLQTPQKSPLFIYFKIMDNPSP